MNSKIFITWTTGLNFTKIYKTNNQMINVFQLTTDTTNFYLVLIPSLTLFSAFQFTYD